MYMRARVYATCGRGRGGARAGGRGVGGRPRAGPAPPRAGPGWSILGVGGDRRRRPRPAPGRFRARALRPGVKGVKGVVRGVAVTWGRGLSAGGRRIWGIRRRRVSAPAAMAAADARSPTPRRTHFNCETLLKRFEADSTPLSTQIYKILISISHFNKDQIRMFIKTNLDLRKNKLYKNFI